MKKKTWIICHLSVISLSKVVLEVRVLYISYGMSCRVFVSCICGFSPRLVHVKVDVNQCVILFIILQQLFLTYQLEINKSFIHSFMIAIFATGIPIKFSFG